jgi:hypothetical protein
MNSVEGYGGGIWWRRLWRDLVEALVEAMVEGLSGGICWREVVEALVEGFDGGKRRTRWWRDIVEGYQNGGGVGGGIWWRGLVGGNGGGVGGGIWWRDLMEGNGGRVGRGIREPKWNSGSSPKVKTSGDPELGYMKPWSLRSLPPPQTRRPLEGCGDDAKRPEVRRV